MERAIEGQRLWLAPLQKAPPHWAVVVVKACVVGILLLPLTTLLWVLLYQPTETSDLGPIAFMVVVGLGAAMFSCAAFLTSTYPRVPISRKRSAQHS